MNCLLPLDQDLDEVADDDVGLAKGNSLFGEVDDRRLLVKIEIKPLSSKKSRDIKIYEPAWIA